MALLALETTILSDGLHRPGAYGTHRIGDLPVLVHSGYDVNLLYVEGARKVPELSEDLDHIPGNQPIQSIAELLGRFVCGTGDGTMTGADVYQDMTAFDMTGIRYDGPCYGIGLVGDQSGGVADDVIVGTLVGKEYHPSIDRFRGYLGGCLDQIGFDIPAKTVHNRTRCGWDHGHLLHPVLPAVEGGRIVVLHITDGDGIEDTWSPPSVRGPVREKFEGTVTWSPRHAACASDQSPPTTDLESGASDTFDLRIDIIT